MTPETTSILFLAADRVEFKGWCQGAFARTALGYDTYAHDPAATRWSIYGAIRREFPINKDWGRTFVYHVMEILRKATGWTGSMNDYNDAPNRTAPEVAHLLRAAALEGLWAC